MLTITDASGKKVAVIDENGKLLSPDPVIHDWYENGVPSMEGSSDGSVVTDTPVLVKRESGARFWMALAEAAEARGWSVDHDEG